MEQYNVLLIEEEFPNLRIIQTDKYINLINKTPEFVHDNWGDFYSDYKVEELSDVIYNSLDKEINNEKISKDILIVDSSSFDSKNIDIEKDYIIKENDGVRIFSPMTPEQEHIESGLLYSFITMFFVEDIFSDKKKGTFQKEYEQEMEKYKEYF